ncbi:MAG TPA: hypothetical protein VL860_14820, partial [Planctomycetota bacterium]|nr:hypothetical protein [Planctomycetota bacterium]
RWYFQMLVFVFVGLAVLLLDPVVGSPSYLFTVSSPPGRWTLLLPGFHNRLGPLGIYPTYTCWAGFMALILNATVDLVWNLWSGRTPNSVPMVGWPENMLQRPLFRTEAHWVTVILAVCVLCFGWSWYTLRQPGLEVPKPYAGTAWWDVHFLLPCFLFIAYCLIAGRSSQRRFRRQAFALSAVGVGYFLFYLASACTPSAWCLFSAPIWVQILQWVLVLAGGIVGGTILVRRLIADHRLHRTEVGKTTSWESIVPAMDGLTAGAPQPPLPALARSSMFLWQLLGAVPLAASFVVIVVKMRYDHWEVFMFGHSLRWAVVLAGLQLALLVALFSPFSCARLVAAAGSALTAAYFVLIWFGYSERCLDPTYWSSENWPEEYAKYTLRMLASVAILPFAWHLLTLEAAEVSVLRRLRLPADQVETGIDNAGDWDGAPREVRDPHTPSA